MDISEKKGDSSYKYFAILFGIFSILIIRAKGSMRKDNHLF